jgi:hypothetical protein
MSSKIFVFSLFLVLIVSSCSPNEEAEATTVIYDEPERLQITNTLQEVAVTSPFLSGETVAPQATNTLQEEVQTNNPADLLGIWEGTRWGEVVNQYYYDDGSFAVKWPDSDIWIARGTYTFAGDQLVLNEQGNEDPTKRGIYMVLVVKDGDRSVRLRYVLVSDLNEERVAFMTEKAHKRIEP